VTDGHAQYYGAQGFTLTSGPPLVEVPIAEAGAARALTHALRLYTVRPDG